MRKVKSVLLLAAIISASLMILPVFAGTGGIRIDPPLPEGTNPAMFEIWVQGKTLASDIHMLLVMTESTYVGLTNVVVSWGVGDSETIPWGGDWTMETDNSVKVPPGATSGAGYTVASLKDHLDTSDPIYWTLVDLWDDSLGKDKVTVTVSLSTLDTDPKMLVYILGKSDPNGLLDMRVPPTIPGFVIPEIPLGTITTILSMVAALTLYTRSYSRKN